MMNKMIVANLVYRPLRSLISIVAIGLEVTMILLIVGLSLGMLNDSRARQQGIGADVIVMPPGSSFIVGLTGAPMSIKVGAPVSPTMNDEPGGITITSAPMPCCRARESFSMPRDNPTISRISVTSNPIATMLISDRSGRYTRLATIILFIIMSN